MKKILGLATLLSTAMLLTACGKSENAPATEQEASAPVVEETVTAEQQAAIDAIDKPVLDEKNTDVPAEVANAPADAVTPADSVSASEPANP